MRTRLARTGCLAFAAAFLVVTIDAAPRGGEGDAALVDAVLRGDATAVQQLLKMDGAATIARGDGLTALHAAAIVGDLPTAETLIAAGADVNAKTALLGSTPIDMAAKNGHGSIVTLLLNKGANPNTPDTLGTTPLMLASAAGDASAVDALLAAGADPNAKESAKSETALMFASAYGRTTAVEALLKHGADWRPTTKVFDWTALPKTDPRLAMGDPHPVKNGKEGEEKAEEKDKEKKENRHARSPSYIELVGTQGGLTALMLASRQGHMGAVQALVEHGADVNQAAPGDSTAALMIAIINGRFDVAMYLLQHGANPNLAQTNGAAPLFAVLNTRWAPKSEYPNPLDYADQKVDYLQLMKTLLDRGADPNARLKRKVWYTNQNNDQSGIDEAGATPFWQAAYVADVQAMKLLVAHGADPAIATMFPGKAVQYDEAPDPAENRDVSGLPPAAVGGPNITPLLAASGEGYGWSFTANHHRYAPTGMLTAVKYLVDVLHADVNARDADGNTALHNAAARGDNEMILYLVSRGADVHAVNRKGQTIADMANGPIQRVQPFPETVSLLATLGVPVRHACVSC